MLQTPRFLQLLQKPVTMATGRVNNDFGVAISLAIRGAWDWHIDECFTNNGHLPVSLVCCLVLADVTQRITTPSHRQTNLSRAAAWLASAGAKRPARFSDRQQPAAEQARMHHTAVQRIPEIVTSPGTFERATHRYVSYHFLSILITVKCSRLKAQDH